MNKIEIVDKIVINDCTPDIASVWELCGEVVAKSLLTNMGGSNIHVPLIRTLTPAMTRFILDLSNTGHSAERIARDLDVSATYVRRHLNSRVKRISAALSTR